MRKKIKWASVVKKQLQACCTHELSVDNHGRDDMSEGFESLHIQISSPIKEYALPSLVRGKSFNFSHVKSIFQSPDSLTPRRRSSESAVPLFSCSTLKTTRLQHVMSSPNLAAADAPSPTELPNPAGVHKSGPLPALPNSFKVSDVDGSHSYRLRVKRHLSDPLPSLPSQPLVGAPFPCNVKHVLLPLSTGSKPKKASGFLLACTNPLKVKSSQGHVATVAPPELPEMVACAPPRGTLQETLLKVTPVTYRRGSRGSMGSRGFQVSKTDCPPPKFPPAGVVRELDAGKYYLRVNSWRTRQKCSVKERNYHSAAVKIQKVFRGHRVRRELLYARGPIRKVTGALEGAASVSTQMSKTKQELQKKPPPLVCKGWNGSLRTAQDCQALLRSKQEAAMKRERALQYGLSRQNWKTGWSQKGPVWSTDDRQPDKPGWVWNWLERATRMGAHTSQNRIYDNDFNNDLQSGSLSPKSTVGMCTTEIGSLDLDFQGWSFMDPWPLSLRQQHAAGLLQGPSPLRKRPANPRQRGASQKMVSAHPNPARRGHRGELQEHFKRDNECPSAESSISSPVTSEIIDNGPRYIVRRLTFLGNATKADQESVGSCVGPLPSYRLSSPFAGPKVRSHQGPLLKLSNSNSMKDTARGGQTRVSVTLSSEIDSVGATAASVRRPFWRP